MKTTALILIAALQFAAAEPPKSPAPALPNKSAREHAIDAARTLDENHDGRITGPEIAKIRERYAQNSASRIAGFDANKNKKLDDSEIAAILFTHKAKPATASVKKPAPPAPDPRKSIGELALDEAKKADQNGDGKITGTEVTVLKMQYAKNPKSWLSVYDDNANKQLDDTEINDLKWGPALKSKKK